MGEPEFRGPLESGLRHPFAVLVPLVLCIGAALAIGLARTPTYTAESRINVGRVDVPAFTLQGVVNGNGVLAAGYARNITAPAVITAAARGSGQSPGNARSNLDASQIPGSTLIRVEGDGSSKAKAVALSNAGAKGLVAYIDLLNRQQQNTGLLARYRRAQSVLARKRNHIADLVKHKAGLQAIQAAEIDASITSLRASRLASLYRSNGSDAAQNSTLQIVSPAVSASSDRGSTVGKLAIIGAAAGLVVGFGLALLLENRALLRRRRSGL
jgi:uncharacterized protein involved in exopolysaccharide biosynthesis